MKVLYFVPTYLPGPEFFFGASYCDTLVLIDTAITTSGVTRTSLKTPAGRIVLSVPIYNVKNQQIKDTQIIQNNWQKQHWHCIELAYKGCKFHELVYDFRDFFLQNKWENLAVLTNKLIKKICKILDLRVKVLRQSALTESLENAYDVEVPIFYEKSYKQINGPYIENLSILDFLFNCGGKEKYEIRKYFGSNNHK